MDITDPIAHAPLLQDDAVPRGFRFAGVRAGIKASGNPDFACILADAPAAAAAMFTSNKVVAAPLIVGRSHLERNDHRVNAVLVNSGNANCATGEAGIDQAQQVCHAAAEAFACDARAVFPSSTGIIGVPLPDRKLIAALPLLQAALGRSAAHFEQAAQAIMTTDTRVKLAATSFDADQGRVRLAGMAKGAGMIFPRLTATGQPALHATMLVYLLTDALLDPETAAIFLQHAVEPTFNRISIDGDTSTNDTVLLLASGASGVIIPSPDFSPVPNRAGPHGDSSAASGEDARDAAAFSSALHAICLSLAKQIIEDGEGVEHVVELNIAGALTDADALRVARSIAHSPLVKTAWAGGDPNWGRILAAIGNAGVPVDPTLIGIRFGNLEICIRGCLSPQFDEAAAHQYLTQRDLSLHIDLGLGEGTCRIWTTDLTQEYVRINADYST